MIVVIFLNFSGDIIMKTKTFPLFKLSDTIYRSYYLGYYISFSIPSSEIH